MRFVWVQRAAANHDVQMTEQLSETSLETVSGLMKDQSTTVNCVLQCTKPAKPLKVCGAVLGAEYVLSQLNGKSRSNVTVSALSSAPIRILNKKNH